MPILQWLSQNGYSKKTCIYILTPCLKIINKYNDKLHIAVSAYLKPNSKLTSLTTVEGLHRKLFL